MHTPLRTRPARAARGGQILPLVALLLVALVGIAALALDGSSLYAQHRRAQAALDVAVKVAAADLFDANPADAAYTPTATQAITAAAQLLAQDGYANALATASSPSAAFSAQPGGGLCGRDPQAGLTFCTPPTRGPFAGPPHFAYVEGTLSRDLGTAFGGVLGLPTLHLSVRAVAWHGGYHQPYAIIGLDPTGCSISVQNTSTALTVRGSIIADGQSCLKGGTTAVSGHSDATLPTDGSNGTQIPGGCSACTTSGVPRITDPYAVGPLAPTPTTAATVICGDATQCATTSFAAAALPAGCSALIAATLGLSAPQPNSYYYLPPASGAALVANFTTKGAVYYFSGSPADIDAANTPTINSFNSVFVLDDANTLIKQAGQAQWVLNAPTSGPFQGLALYEQEPCSTSPPTSLTLTGNATSLINGVIDAPCAVVTLSGNATGSPFVNGVVVGADVVVAGSSSTIVNYDPTGTPPDKGSVLVE